jgi:Ca2+-binding RTX toxin-like protein
VAAFVLATAGVTLAATSLPAQAAGAFSNTASIPIGPNAGISTASSIVVSGQPVLTDVNVTLNGFSHQWPSEVDVMVEGPTGVRVMVMSDVPSTNPSCAFAASGLTLVFDDGAAEPVPSGSALHSGTFRPTNSLDGPNCNEVGGDALVPTATTLSAFNGTDPNGVWKLHVADDTAVVNGGAITGGWTLGLSSAAAAPSASCRGIPATVVGTDGPETLTGTPGNDVIAALGGDDTVYGLGGDDIVCGDTGNDKLKGDIGRDILVGGPGTKDVCKGGPSKDRAKSCERVRSL